MLSKGRIATCLQAYACKSGQISFGRPVAPKDKNLEKGFNDETDFMSHYVSCFLRVKASRADVAS